MNIEISSTHVLTQKYFKDEDLNIFAIDIMSMNIKTWRDEIKDNWIEITKKEAELISNPPLSDNEIKLKRLQQKKDDLDIIETKITRLERIKQRTETEEQELDRLIDESTVLYRKITAAENEEGETK